MAHGEPWGGLIRGFGEALEGENRSAKVIEIGSSMVCRFVVIVADPGVPRARAQLIDMRRESFEDFGISALPDFILGGVIGMIRTWL